MDNFENDDLFDVVQKENIDINFDKVDNNNNNKVGNNNNKVDNNNNNNDFEMKKRLEIERERKVIQLLRGKI